jgi:hypothetical protein
MRKNTTLLQRDFDSLAMAIEDGRWNDDDPRTDTIVAAAQARGLASAALSVLVDRSAPAPVRERALACVAGQLLTEESYSLAS